MNRSCTRSLPRPHNLPTCPPLLTATVWQVKGRITLVAPFGLFQPGADVAEDERLLIVHHQLLKVCRSAGDGLGDEAQRGMACHMAPANCLLCLPRLRSRDLTHGEGMCKEVKQNLRARLAHRSMGYETGGWQSDGAGFGCLPWGQPGSNAVPTVQWAVFKSGNRAELLPEPAYPAPRCLPPQMARWHPSSWSGAPCWTSWGCGRWRARWVLRQQSPRLRAWRPVGMHPSLPLQHTPATNCLIAFGSLATVS